MRHTFLLTIVSVLLTGTLFSQTEVDLYRYSNTFNEGSARFEAMSGSFGAIGAELGAARINPAAFGRFSASKFSFGLSNISLSNTSDFNNVSTVQKENKTRLSNLGVVLASDLSTNQRGWFYQQLGVGYNSIANFGNSIKYTGQQFASLLDGFAAQANGVAPADLYTYFPFSSAIAYETYAINPDGNGGYFPDLNSGDVIHTRTIDTKGGMGEIYASYSANYLDKLYLGVNVGFQTLRYEEVTKHREEVTDPAGISLRSFDYTYDLQTKGNGTNVKIGAIYAPVPSFRVGLAVHSPTYFELTDNFSADMTTTLDTSVQTVPQDLKPVGNYKYRMRTPARMVGSLGFVFQDKGCINIDLEYLDYRWAHFRSTNDAAYQPYDFQAENDAADARFTSALNVRIGGEAVIAEHLFIRGGFAVYPKGDKNLLSYGGDNDTNISGGLGYRFTNASLDLGVRNLRQTRTYQAFQESMTTISTNALYFVLNFNVSF
jgi:hypothetical protein